MGEMSSSPSMSEVSARDVGIAVLVVEEVEDDDFVILLVDTNDSFRNDGVPYSSSVVTPNGVHAKLQYLYKFIECLIVCVLVLERSSLTISTSGWKYRRGCLNLQNR